MNIFAYWRNLAHKCGVSAKVPATFQCQIGCGGNAMTHQPSYIQCQRLLTSWEADGFWRYCATSFNSKHFYMGSCSSEHLEMYTSCKQSCVRSATHRAHSLSVKLRFYTFQMLIYNFTLQSQQNIISSILFNFILFDSIVFCIFLLFSAGSLWAFE